MKRTIFHVDVNSAFLSWSAVKRLKEDPNALDLRTVPAAVGGDVRTRHGIITAKSIPAKKYGIKTAMPVMRALELCPELVLVESDFTTYRKYSDAFIGILRQYARVVEQVSIDEAFLDMSGTEETISRAISEAVAEGNIGRDIAAMKFPYNAAWLIKERIRNELLFTVNVGISSNKLLAKMASDFEKPDKVHTLYPEEVPEKMWPLPIGTLFGCGSKTAAKLEKMGFHTIGEVAHMDPGLLRSILGEKGGAYIYESANGRSQSPVSDARAEAKSISNELTTTVDITEENFETEGFEILKHLSEKVAGRLKKHGFYAFTIGVGIKTDDFRRHQIQVKLRDPVQKPKEILETARRLYREILTGKDGLFQEGLRVRLISVAASGLDHGEFQQMTLEDYLRQQRDAKEAEQQAAREDKARRLREMSDKIRRQFGQDAICTARELPTGKSRTSQHT